MLKKIFTELVYQYNKDSQLSEKLWNEIEKAYSGKKRHYHNLSHLEALYYLLSENKHHISDLNTVLFSLFYHDIVYNVLKSNNEQKSAELANKRLKEIGFPKEQAMLCHNQILATSNHNVTNNADTNIFTDADLSILGRETTVYETYCEQIRKEYSIFPDFVYKPGRKKVVLHFLQMERIFKTDFFFEQFEQKARDNLNRELLKLNE